MSPRLRVYVGVVTVIAAVLLAITVPHADSGAWAHYALWALLCLGAEFLWLPTVQKDATVSMAASVNIATLTVWGQGPAMLAVGASTFAANTLFQKKPWVRAVFNTAQIVITMWVSGAVVHMLGNPIEGMGAQGRLPLDQHSAIRVGALMFAAYVTYALVNRSLVTVAVAWSSDRRFLRALREDWFSRERLFIDVSQFFLAPLMVLGYGAVGYLGLVLFYAPLQMIYETHKRYLELLDAQNQLIHTERMAAKGEMAAEIGHELNNQLVAISGRAQMLVRDAQRGVFENVDRHAQLILEQSKRVQAMSKGLMEFSSVEIRVERLDLNVLVQRSVEFVRPQNRFDDVEWDLRLASGMPELRADPGQIQQVLINLFVNAADAMGGNGGVRKTLLVASEYDERGHQVRLTVQDTGSGIAPNVMPRIFEPHFTTKPEGHGFGLSTSYRIVTNHGGRITAASLPTRGARFVVTLPLHGPGGWSA